MGIQTWYDPDAPVDAPLGALTESLAAEETVEAVPTDSEVEQSVAIAAEPSVATDSANAEIDISQLQQQILDCNACELHATRRQAIPGEGNSQARLMIVTHAPVEENQLDVLFKQHQLKMLDAMLNAIGESRSSIYATSLVKCLPPQGRDAYTSEVICCDDHLSAQIKHIKPSVILLLGEQASQQLLVSQKSLMDLRLRHHQHLGVPVIVSYHPAELINSVENKRKAWQDLLHIKNQLMSVPSLT